MVFMPFMIISPAIDLTSHIKRTFWIGVHKVSHATVHTVLLRSFKRDLLCDFVNTSYMKYLQNDIVFSFYRLLDHVDIKRLTSDFNLFKKIIICCSENDSHVLQSSFIGRGSK